MKGFIEVHTTNDKTVLINVNAIETVLNKQITVIGSEEFWRVKETYEELVDKIRKAVKE